VSRLNPDATLIIPDEPKFQRFDVERIINTGLFNMEKAQESAGWITEVSSLIKLEKWAHLLHQVPTLSLFNPHPFLA
jgi:hypothetical protein